MTTAGTNTLHALLIGIDNYANSPLSGCVNDIQKVGALLTKRLGVKAETICKIVATRDDVQRPGDADPRSPTHANLVAALQEMAKKPKGERVFIYYSGHGSNQKMPDAESYFEGIVPLDYEDTGLLFDVEMNGLLQAISDNSEDLTLILDCCHSAGATREVGNLLDAVTARFIEVRDVAPARPLAGQEAPTPQAAAEGKASVPYTVLAACHADEKAAECRIPPKVGEIHGLLTSALLDTLGDIGDDEKLATLRWSDFWEPLKERVFRSNPSQRPQLLGTRDRRLFGGPCAHGDIGYAVRQNPDKSYTIAAGSLAGLGKGAQLAVYGATPALFPDLGTKEDSAARLGVLVIDSVAPAEAAASPKKDKDGKDTSPFDLPAIARGRLIKQGAPDLLRVGVGANLDPKVRAFLEESQQFDMFTLLSERDASAEVQVGQLPDGDIWIGDDLNGPGAEIEPQSPGPMARVRRSHAKDEEDMATGLRAGLNHYAQYVVPLRAYRNGGFTLPQAAVKVRLLDANDESKRQQFEKNCSIRSEVRRDNHGRYRLANNDAIAIHVHNSLSIDLHVTLLLCTLEGQIQFLDGDVKVDRRSGKIFWKQNIIGQPFRLESPGTFAWGIDRLIVIATDLKGIDLTMLEQGETMDEIIKESIGTKSMRPQAKNPSALRWMAEQVLIQIEEPKV